jgi:hypothetical protein
MTRRVALFLHHVCTPLHRVFTGKNLPLEKRGLTAKRQWHLTDVLVRCNSRTVSSFRCMFFWNAKPQVRPQSPQRVIVKNNTDGINCDRLRFNEMVGVPRKLPQGLTRGLVDQVAMNRQLYFEGIMASIAFVAARRT